MSSDEFTSLHDVYQGLVDDDKCQKTQYVVQFLWRDLSSDFDAIGPHFTCSTTMETAHLHSMVIRTMLSFCQFGFLIRALLCDGASTNLSLLKKFCGYSNDEEIEIRQPWFKSPFDGRNIYASNLPITSSKFIINAYLWVL